MTTIQKVSVVSVDEYFAKYGSKGVTQEQINEVKLAQEHIARKNACTDLAQNSVYPFQVFVSKNAVGKTMKNNVLNGFEKVAAPNSEFSVFVGMTRCKYPSQKGTARMMAPIDPAKKTVDGFLYNMVVIDDWSFDLV